MFGGSGSFSDLRPHFPLAIEINRGQEALILRGALALVNKGYTPYLFRYSKKRNRTTSPEGKRDHDEIRKGWNVVGRADTAGYRRGVARQRAIRRRVLIAIGPSQKARSKMLNASTKPKRCLHTCQ